MPRRHLGILAFAVDCASRAGDLVMAEMAVDEAAELYRLGLQITEILEPSPVATRCALLVQLGHALCELDDPDSPEMLLDAARTAFAHGRLDIVADAMWVMAPFRSVFAHHPDVLTLVQQALAIAEPADLGVRARLTCVLALQAAGLDDREQRHELMAAAIDLARAVGQPRLLMQVFTWNWYATFHPGNLDRRRAIVEEQLALAQQEHSLFFEKYARAARCGALLEIGDVVSAEAEAKEIEALARRATIGRPGPESCSAAPRSSSSMATSGRRKPRPSSCSTPFAT